MSVEREMSLAEWCAKLPSLHLVNQELSTLNTQLAALAEQNEKLREALEAANRNLITWVKNYTDSPLYDFITKAIDLPELASPVLNRIRAEGMREAEALCDIEQLAEPVQTEDDRSYNAAIKHCIASIRARAAELEKSNG